MKKFILLAAVAFSLTACNSEDNYIDDPVAAHISATIGQNSMSRASDDSWAAGDNIGISMGNRYHNIKFSTENGDGDFVGSTTLYFRNKVDTETITAYYPFSGIEGETPAAIETTTGAERQTSEEQPKFDFLYAKQENVTGADPNVDLTFSHKMCKLSVTLIKGNDGTDVTKITSCEINGLVLEGTFNPVTGVCAAKTDIPASPLTMTPTLDNKNMKLSLIIFPQSVDKITLKITDREAQTYICELNNNNLESGNNYLYNITVKKTGMTINNSSIDEWTNTPMTGDAVSD